MNIEQLYQIFLQHPTVTTDTRTITRGAIFFALKGASFNGNSFAAQALDNGAAYAVIDDKDYYIDERTILVEDVLSTLQQLAKHHRRQFSIPFIAITGSNGKTTTKELVAGVLGTTYKTYTTQGNLNNHIGIPLTILRVEKDAEMAVIEMGANHQKEIEGYCTYTLPTHGLITNIGKAHLEGFGGIEGVRKGKGELFDYLRSYKGTAFVMWDYDYLRQMSSGIAHICTYGSREADICGKILQSEPFLSLFANGVGEVKTRLVGDYNFPNAMAAVAIGTFFNVPAQNIKSAIERYTPSNSRSQMLQQGSNHIILDAYNANPGSMKAAIENFAKLNAKNKVLLLGAMAELGEESLAEHRAVVSLIENYQWNAVVLVGGDFLKVKHSFLQLENSVEAGEWLRNQQFENTYVLVKGSRSMKMETVLG